MRKSVKIILFLLLFAALAAAGWHYFKDRLSKTNDYFETQKQNAAELNFLSFVEKASGIDSPKTYLVLFQNSMELRPAGGFIGSFAKIKLAKGKIIEKEIYDTTLFDQTLKNPPKPPYLIEKYLHTQEWGVRDSNWFFHFPTSSQKTIEVYKKSPQHQNDEIDGVIAITSNVLPYLLEKTGPITLEGITGEFTPENCVEKLEFEVEKGYVKRDVKFSERKNALKDLSEALTLRLTELGKLEQLALLNDSKKLLKTKDIQFYFTDESMENYALKNNWGGAIIPSQNDYLAVVDTNLGALKTNRCLSYQVFYKVDFSANPKPKATLNVRYKNNCQEKNFMTDNYHGYLSIFVPQDSFLNSTQGFDEDNLDEIVEKETDTVIENAKDKKVFGDLVYIWLNKERSYTFLYDLPSRINSSDYQLYFQKQAGLNNLWLQVTVIEPDTQQKVIFEGAIKEDTIIKK